jgi:murein DD-endopeptidase MepM/ murein hydrolase activator NlpD
MNKFKYLIILGILFSTITSHAGSGIYKDTIVIKAAIDTLFDAEKRPVILFGNNQWFYEDEIYSGSYFIDTLIPLTDTSIVFGDFWIHHHVHNDTTELMDMADTIKIPLNCNEHTDYCLPRFAKVNYKFGFRRYRYHYGVDIKAYYNDEIFSCFDGKVRYTGYNGNYGNVVVIRHFNGLETVYSHLSKIRVVENQMVRAGTLIGLAGNTGRSTGPHLHFEVRYKGNAIDPELVFDFNHNKLVNDTLILNKEVFAYKKEINQRIYHKIRPGDTLSGLAYNYSTSVSSICRLNGINTKTTLRVGRTLRVR